MSTILITGATGGLGSAVAKFLREKKAYHQIAVLIRNRESEKAKALEKQGYEIRVGDYNDSESLLKAFEGIDILYFVSGNDIANRVPQHKNVVEAASKAGVSHVFYTSVSLNNLSPDSPLYGAMHAHLETEKWLKESGLKYTFLRHNLYSEVIPMFLGTKDQLMGSKTVFLPTGEGKTSFVPRINLAEAGANALANPEVHENAVYELNGSEKSTFREIAQYLSEITGESIAYVSPDVAEFEETMVKLGVPAEYIGMMTLFGLGISDGVFDAPTSDLDTLLGKKSIPTAEYLSPIYQ